MLDAEVIQVTPDDLPAGMTLADFEPLGSSEVVTRWEYQRAHLVQVRYEMPKLQASADKSVIVHASAPPTPMRGGKYGSSFYAHVAVQRVLNNMPLQRLASSWRRDGIDIAPSVLVHIFHRAAFLLAPIHERLQQEVRATAYVCADETPQPMQAPGKGKTQRGWMWMALCKTAIVYHFATSRSAEAGRELLGDQIAHLMVDGYSGYNGLAATEGRSACWAHARRAFWELRQHWPEANAILDAIRELYRIEIQTLARSDDPATLLRMRTHESRRHVEEVFRIADSLAGHFSDTSAQSKAIGYLTRRRNELTRFLEDPNVPLDKATEHRCLRHRRAGRQKSRVAA